MEEPKIQYWLDGIIQPPITFQEMEEIVKFPSVGIRGFNMVEWCNYLAELDAKSSPD
jgi:hypothetical protein